MVADGKVYDVNTVNNVNSYYAKECVVTRASTRANKAVVFNDKPTIVCVSSMQSVSQTDNDKMSNNDLDITPASHKDLLFPVSN